MKLGNRHLQHKLSAMTEAAQKEDSPDESTPTTPNMNGKRVVINLDDFKESTTLQLIPILERQSNYHMQ